MIDTLKPRIFPARISGQSIDDFTRLLDDEHHPPLKKQLEKLNTIIRDMKEKDSGQSIGGFTIPLDDDHHPPLEKRIEKLNTIIRDMKEEDKGRCFNSPPYRKINGLPQWGDCDEFDQFKFEE